MNKEFVSYEQAVALKELGFDEPCFGYYNYNGSHFFKFKPRTDDKNLTKAPLYQQAFRWLHEQLGFKSSCMPLDVEHRETVLNNNIKSLKEKYGNTNM